MLRGSTTIINDSHLLRPASWAADRPNTLSQNSSDLVTNSQTQVRVFEVVSEKSLVLGGEYQGSGTLLGGLSGHFGEAATAKYGVCKCEPVASRYPVDNFYNREMVLRLTPKIVPMSAKVSPAFPSR